MKAKSSLSLTHVRKMMFLCIVFFSTFVSAQTTIINYNFDVAKMTDYGKFYTRYVNGITSTLTSSDAYSQGIHDGTTGSITGTATGAGAFYANTVTSPNRVCGVSSATATHWFNFRLSGSSLKAYTNTFKIYFQAKYTAASGGSITSIDYSVDGGAFSSFATPGTMSTTWTEYSYSLPSISPNSYVDIKMNISTTGLSKYFAIDNFQIQAVGPSVATAAFASNHPIAGNIFQNTTSNLLASCKIDAHISATTPSNITFTTAGTYLVTDVTNFKLWQNNYNSFYGATQVGSTIASAASASNISFNTGFISIPAGTSSYFFLTADVGAAAVAGGTISITSTAFTNITLSGSPTEVGISPLIASNIQTITANAGTAASNVSKYTSMTTAGSWDNGGTTSRWSNVTGGPYTTLKWTPNSIANLEGTGGNFDINTTTGPVVQQINVTSNSYNLRTSISPATVGVTLTHPSIINISGANVLKLSNNSGASTTNVDQPLLTPYGLVKQGTGELAFVQPFNIYTTCTQGPIYINGGTVTLGDKSSTSANPNLFVYDNDFFINNGKFTIAAPSSTYVSPGYIHSITVDGTGSNSPVIEIYNTAGGGGSLYSEMTYDDRYPQLSADLVPLSVKGNLSFGYGGTLSGVTSAVVIGNVNFTGNTTFKPLTNAAGNIASSSGIIMNAELAGEGARSGLAAGLIGNFTFNDNGYTMLINGGGSSSCDGGYISINGSGSSTGAWTVGNADGTQAGYLSINDVTGLTSNSITVNQNSQLDINVTGATINIAKTPTITLNGAKSFSYYGAMALYNYAAGTTTSKLSSPIVVNTSDATVGIYNDDWTLAGAITGSGGFQLYGNVSTYTLKLSSPSNTWTGGTKVLSGVLTVSSNSSISTGPLTMGQLSTFNTRINLNNPAQTISALSTSWSNTTGTRVQVVNLSSGHILTINQSSNTTFGDGAVSTLAAVIQGAGNIIKDGTGTLTFTGANTYTGITQVKGGILKLSGLYTTAVLPSTNDVHIIGGTLQVSTNQTLNNIILSTGTLQVDNGVTLTINGTLTLVNGSINLVGTGKIAYGASGTLTYAGSNSQTSSTLEIPAASGPKGITNDNNTNNGLTLSANISNLTGASINNGWLDFNGKTLTGTGTFTSNGPTGPYSVTGNTSTASSVITNVSSTASLGLGMKLTSSSLSANTFVIYIDPLVANTVTLNQVASATQQESLLVQAGEEA
jgi:autotransporter-associated beta strand protein